MSEDYTPGFRVKFQPQSDNKHMTVTYTWKTNPI